MAKPSFFPNSQYEIEKFILDTETSNIISLAKDLAGETEFEKYEKLEESFISYYRDKTTFKMFYDKINVSKQLRKLVLIDILIAFLDK